MPMVPTSVAPEVAPIGLPGATFQTPTRFLAESQVPGEQVSKLGAGMVRAGDELLTEATRQQADENQSAAKDYDTKHTAAIDTILHGDPNNPGTGFLQAKGKDALDKFDSTVQALGKVSTDLASGLANPAQQELVKTISAQRTQAAVVRAVEHRAQQSDVYARATGELRLKTAQDSAALNFNPITDTPTPNFDADNPGANTTYQQALQTIRSEATDLATRVGLTEPQDVDAYVRNAMAKAYIGTLSHLIDRKGGNPADLKIAQQFFTSVKDALPADAQDKVRAVLEAGNQKDQALTLALEVKASGGSIDKQEGALDAKFKSGEITADVHAMALQHLRADNSQRRAEQGESDKAMIGQVWDLARNGGDITSLSPSQLNYIKQRGLGPNIDQIFKRADKADFDDSKQFSDLMRMSAEDPSGFTKMDLSTVSGSVTPAHWNHLMNIQTGINRGDLRAADVNKVTHTAVLDTKAQLLASGFNLNPKPNTEAAKQLDQFQASLYDAVTAAQPGWIQNKLSPGQMREEARTITQGMLKDQVLSGTGYFGTTVGQTHMPAWKMTPDQRAAPWEIPPDDRQQIVQSLQRANLPPSEDNIQRAYKAKQGMR